MKSRKKRKTWIISAIKKHYPLIMVIGVLWLVIGALLGLSISRNQGHFIYATDDPYIHMATAKNLVQHGVWGVTKYGFTSSSSSLLWTLLLSLIYYLFGINDISPLILNIVFATSVCVLFYILLRRYDLKSFPILIILALTVFLTPVPSLVFGGQEHILHLLVTVLFVYLAAKILYREKPAFLEFLPLLILCPFLTASRYEGLFLLFVIMCLFAMKKEWPYSLFLGVSGITPIAVYGMLSVSQGWCFLPNSILIKGRIPDLTSLSGIVGFFGWLTCKRFFRAPHMLVLVVLATAVYIVRAGRGKNIWENKQIMIAIFVLTTFLHMLFAQTGRFFRYEAYLVALGIFVLGVLAGKNSSGKFKFNTSKKDILKYAGFVLSGALIAFPLCRRGWVALKRTPQATTNIYEQQYQMGLFLRKFYQGKTVAAVDIGAINYLADIRCLDLWGLASMEVLRLKRDKKYDTEAVYKLAAEKRVKIAILYDKWFDRYGGIPSQWIKIDEWKISNNVVCGDDTVSFYAINSAEMERLRKSLKAFSQRLPKDVS